MKIPKFKRKDMDEIHRWLKAWSQTKEGRPDWTSDAIYLLPLMIALLSSEAKLSILTFVLIILTATFIVETFILIF